MAADWVQAQVTIGNILVVLSMVANIGYQMRRLQGIEKDLARMEQQHIVIRRQQEVDRAEIGHQLDMAARHIEQTYSRRDVQEALIASVHQQLGTLMAQQSDMRAEVRAELRDIKAQGRS